MFSLLLVIIYIAFISLGLPDSILGSAWPSMYEGLQVPVSYVSILSMIISAGTIVSSMSSGKVLGALGTGKVTAVSVAMTAVALFGFSFSSSFFMLCLWGIPYGLGAGSVDAALNNYVALHYKSRHMNWLHCFWGVGATVGPYIMGLCLTNNLKWNRGYQVIGVLQTVLVIGLLFSLPLWKQPEKEGTGREKRAVSMKFSQILKMKGAKKILFGFFSYCAVETTAGLWASSFLVLEKGINAETAAKWASLFYLGITGGRFLSGFVADKIGDKNMVRIGQALCLVSVGLLFVPLGVGFTLGALVLLGVGCAPIYPGLIHETPENFGPEKSQAIMGVQMGCAYIGTTCMPVVFGAVTNLTGLGLYPVFLLVVLLMMIAVIESLNLEIKKENRL